jgi:small subunit ribosomal protein S20
LLRKYIEEEFELANHKSALKRNRQSLVRRERNRINRSKVKTVLKKVDAAIQVEDSVDKAREALIAAVPVIERAAVKGAFHKRTASRKVSRLTKKVNAFIRSKESAA